SQTLVAQSRIIRPLTAQLAGASLTPAAARGLLRDLRAFPVGNSTTPGATRLLVRSLGAALTGITTVPPGGLRTARHLAALLQGSSATSSGLIASGFFSAHLVAVSGTPPAKIAMDVAKHTLHRIEYPTEVLIVRPDGTVVRVIRKS